MNANHALFSIDFATCGREREHSAEKPRQQVRTVMTGRFLDGGAVTLSRLFEGTAPDSPKARFLEPAEFTIWAAEFGNPTQLFSKGLSEVVASKCYR